jgi:hypothetical protein
MSNWWVRLGVGDAPEDRDRVLPRATHNSGGRVDFRFDGGSIAHLYVVLRQWSPVEIAGRRVCFEDQPDPVTIGSRYARTYARVSSMVARLMLVCGVTMNDSVRRVCSSATVRRWRSWADVVFLLP